MVRTQSKKRSTNYTSSTIPTTLQSFQVAYGLPRRSKVLRAHIDVCKEGQGPVDDCPDDLLVEEGFVELRPLLRAVGREPLHLLVERLEHRPALLQHPSLLGVEG